MLCNICTAAGSSQGRSYGGYIGYIYPPKISPSKLFMGKNDV